MKEFDIITGDAIKFIKWSDTFNSAQDSPELCQAALVSEKIVIGHCHGLSVLHGKFRTRLDHFLKSTFTDVMDHKHIDKIMTEKETYGLLVCRYPIDDEDVNIFSCLIFEYLDQDNFDAPTVIVYITFSPMFCQLKLAPLMLASCQLCFCYNAANTFCWHQHPQPMNTGMRPNNLNTSIQITSLIMMNFQLTRNL